jgi:hypothetical protein
MGGYFAPDLVQRSWIVRSALVVFAGVCAIVGLVLEVTRRRTSLSTTVAPLACLASVVLLGLVVALERGSALDQRYVVLGATLVFTTYMCLSMLEGRLAILARWALAIPVLALLPWNTYQAIAFGDSRRNFEANLVRDVQAGVPVDLLGARYYPDIWGDPTIAAGAIREMRDDGIGPFAAGDLQLNEREPVVSGEERLSTAPVAVRNMTRVGEYWQGTGGDSFLLYTVEARNVAGVRLTYSLSNATEHPAYLQMAWSSSPAGIFDPKANTFVVWGAPTNDQPQQVVAWIGETIDLLKVTPDTEPVSFRVDSVTLLLAP